MIGGGDDVDDGGVGDRVKLSHRFQPSGLISLASLPIALEVQVSLHARDRENITNLRAETDDARFKGTQSWSAALVRA